MGFKRFSLLIVIRVTLILVAILALISLIQDGHYRAGAFVVGIIILFQCYELFRFVSKTNRELSRFLDAARYADFSQRFELSARGAGFEELDPFDDVLGRRGWREITE